MITRFAPHTSILHFKSFACASPPGGLNTPSPATHLKPAPRLPMPAFQRARLRAKVAAITCSEPWTEQVADKAEHQGILPNAANISAQLEDRGLYPPRPELGPDCLPRMGAVRMRQCDACGRIVPPNNIASSRLIRLCDDCRFEPDLDRDESIDRADARAPGAQLDVLMEGLIDDDANRHAAREQLHQIGLTAPEITAMVFTHEGYSTRRVADLGRWSQTYVRKLLKSAAEKIRRSGLVVPKPANDGTSHRPLYMNPVKLDGMTEHVR